MQSWSRRNKTVATLLGTVIVLLLMLSIGGLLTAIQQTRLTRQMQEELNAKNISQLYQDWYSGNVERVGAELKRHYETADTRGFFFEWELLRTIYQDSRKTIISERGDETRLSEMVTFSPDGRWLACGLPGDRVGIYDLVRKTFRQLDNEPAGGAADVAFSPDQKEIITLSWTGVINRRDVATSRVIGPVIECRIAGEEGEIVSWSDRFELSPDGRTVAVGMANGDFVLAWLETGECHRIHAHDGQILAMAFSPDGSTILSSGWNRSIKFWNVHTNQLSRLANTSSLVLAARFTSDGSKLVVTDSLKGIRILDAASLEELPGPRSEYEYVGKLSHVSR